MLHAGGVEGWVEGADLVFRSKTNSDDYHDEMNSQHYMEWLTGQLLPVLDKPTVIILDNASYHNKQKDQPPTSNDRKDDIRKWLDEHNIQYSQTDIKKTLLQLVKQHRPAPLYLTDEAIQNMGHTVLRLPVAHCELNPIELAWASVKGYVAKHNRDYTFAEVERLTPEGLKHTTTEMWRHFCRHVVDVENEYFEKDGIVEDVVEEMIIAVGDDSDEEVEEEDDMVDDDDRQLIGMTLRQSTSTDGQSTSTNGQSTPTRQSTFTDSQHLLDNPHLHKLHAQIQDKTYQNYFNSMIPTSWRLSYLWNDPFSTLSSPWTSPIDFGLHPMIYMTTPLLPFEWQLLGKVGNDENSLLF